MRREQIWLRLTLGCDPVLGAGCFCWFVAAVLLSPFLSFGDHASLSIVLIYLCCSAAGWYCALEVTRRRAEVAATLLVPRLGRYTIEGLLLLAAAQIIVPSLVIGLARRSPSEGLASCAIQVTLFMGGLIAVRMNPRNIGRLQGGGWVFFYLAIMLLGLEKAMWGAGVPHFFGWAVTVLTTCLTAVAAWLYWPALVSQRRYPSVITERKADSFIRAMEVIFLGKYESIQRDTRYFSKSKYVFERNDPQIKPMNPANVLHCVLWKELDTGSRWRYWASQLLPRLAVLGLVGGVTIGIQYLISGELRKPPNLTWFFLVMLNSTTLEQAKQIWSLNQYMSADRELVALIPGFGRENVLKTKFLKAVILPSIQAMILDIFSINIGVFAMSIVYGDYIKYNSIFAIIVINTTVIVYSSERVRVLLKVLLGAWDPNKSDGIHLASIFISLPFLLLMIVTLEAPGPFMAGLAGICALIALYITAAIRNDLRVYFSCPHPFLPKH